MATRKAVRLAVCVAGLALALPLQSASAQSYPKLMTNGHGLALTRFAVQEKAGSNWIASPSLRQGVEYRVILRFTNYFSNVYSYGGGVRDIIRLSFSVENGFATFFPSEHYYGSGTRFVNGYDEAGLEPTRSKTFYQYFKWNGPPMPTPMTAFKVTFTGGEVNLLPRQSGDLRPGS